MTLLALLPAMPLPEMLRAAVVAVAVLGVIDPAVTVSRRPLLDVDVAVPRRREAAGRGVPADGVPSDDAVAHARASLVRALTAAVDGEVRLRVRAFAAGERLPCASDVPCLVLADASVAPRGGLARKQPLFVLPAPEAPASQAVTLDDVVLAPARLDEQAVATVRLSSSTSPVGETQIDVFDGAVPVGASRHTWTSESPVTLSVPWWPAQAGVRRLTVTATTVGRDVAATAPQRIDAVVEVSDTPWPVLVIEPRPSWATTFARRALEQDRRMDVEAHVVLGPGLATGVGRTGLDDRRVEHARVVVAGAPDALTEQDVRRFERFLTERGGAVVLVPDADVTGPITRLLPGRWRHRLDAAPAAAGDLHASEWLFASGLAAGDVVMAAHDSLPVVVSRAAGEGRLVVVGALDAWRFRSAPVAAAGSMRTPGVGTRTAAGARGPTVGQTSSIDLARSVRDDTSYASFWQGVIGELARGSAPPVAVTVRDTPGDDHATVDVQARTLDPRATWTASARVACGGDVRVVRLWPQARAGHFRGEAPWPPDGTGCAVAAAIDGIGEGRALLAAPSDTPAGRQRAIARLRATAVSSGGVAASSGDVAAVARALVALRPMASTAEVWHPMRSWWWGLAAALGLGVEWWWRRRAGLR